MIASHVIIGAYGFWLPNDPRGSWSDFVGAWDLFRYGPATKTNERRSLAHRDHNRAVRRATKEALKYPAVTFTGLQARAVGIGFAEFAAKSGLTIWACAIMPEHLHLVIARHRYGIEQAVNLLKGAATARLVLEGIHPLQKFPGKAGRPPKAFAQNQWKVYLDDVQDVRRAIRYVEGNPDKEGLPQQRWSCVTPFLG